MERPRVVGHVVSVFGFRLKVELSSEAKSSSRATLDGVQRAVAINSFLTFDLGAGTHAIGSLTDLEARESYDPQQDEELSLELTKPRRIASIQLLGTVKQHTEGRWKFDPGITILPTLDTPAEVASPNVLASVFGEPPERNEPRDWYDFFGPYDFALEIGHLTGDENTKIRASFNDLFSRPLAIVGNTGSGKSYTVASLLRGAIENEAIETHTKGSPHVFILDINGEYAAAFLPEDERNYAREPNEGYANGKKLAVPIWLMNSEEVSEWLSASEQTQQPVLKAWWAYLKSHGTSSEIENDFLDEALACIRSMYPLSNLTKNNARDRFLAIASFVGSSGLDIGPLQQAVAAYLVRDKGEYKNFYRDQVTNPAEIDVALKALTASIEATFRTSAIDNEPAASGDTPTYISGNALRDTGSLIAAASTEDAQRLDQHLTTLRMRLKTRLADKRWSIFTNFDDLNIKSAKQWFESLGFVGGGVRITVLDLSMLSHEVLPFICSTIGRVLLEAREKLPSNERYSNPWVLVLEEAHNYARPPRQVEDRGQVLSRRAFERVAKEGRKFGLSLIVASQRPSEISATIISQCANFFSHRLQNPDDIDHFKRIIPKQAQRLLDQVTVLASGEAIVFGSAVHIPSRVQIKRPTQEPSSITAAPFYEWSLGGTFPLDKVLEAWGAGDSGDNLRTDDESPPDDDLPTDDIQSTDDDRWTDEDNGFRS